MTKIAAFVAVRPLLFSDALCKLLTQEADIQVTGLVDPISETLDIGKTFPTSSVVIHSRAADVPTPVFYSLWLKQHQGLRILSLLPTSFEVFSHGVHLSLPITDFGFSFVPGLLREIFRRERDFQERMNVNKFSLELVQTNAMSNNFEWN